MIYALKRTEQGLAAISHYDGGANSKLTFVEAVILAKVSSNDGLTLFHELHSSLVRDCEDYVSSKNDVNLLLRKLYSRNLLIVIDDMLGLSALFRLQNGFVFHETLRAFYTWNDVNPQDRSFIERELRVKGTVSYHGLRISI